MKRLIILLSIFLGLYLVLTVIINLPQRNTTSNTTTFQSPSPTTTSEKVKTEDLVVGTGQEAKTGDTVNVTYIGTLTNGTVFDKNEDANKPFSFRLGAGDVIKGWDEGIVGMKVGGKRRLTVPASLAYGPQAVGTIPANSTLIFEVTLVNVVAKNSTTAPNPGVNF